MGMWVQEHANASLVLAAGALPIGWSWVICGFNHSFIRTEYDIQRGDLLRLGKSWTVSHGNAQHITPAVDGGGGVESRIRCAGRRTAGLKVASDQEVDRSDGNRNRTLLAADRLSTGGLSSAYLG